MSTEISHLQCLCGAINEPAPLLASATLPIQTELCHYNICRQTTGALAATFANLTGSPCTKSLGACTRNSTSGWRVERYHCSICGTRVFDHATNTGNWLACSGIVEPKMSEGEHPRAESENVIKIVSHDFVGDTGE